MLAITDITIDDRCQPREALDHRTVAEYADDMREGATFAPVTVFTDGTSHWLADGFHRVAAARLASLDTIAVEVKAGTLRDAILYAAGANGTHGLRRTNADKRRAVSRLLDDAEWSTWSDREIARKCGVTHPFVARVRSERSGNGYHSEIEIETQLRALMHTIRSYSWKTIEELDAVKAKLTPSQYRAWTEQALGISEEAETRLRQGMSDANPDAYLGFWLDRMIDEAA